MKKFIQQIIVGGAAALALTGIGSVSGVFNNNAPAQKTSATSETALKTSAGNIQLAGRDITKDRDGRCYTTNLVPGGMGAPGPFPNMPTYVKQEVPCPPGM